MTRLTQDHRPARLIQVLTALCVVIALFSVRARADAEPETSSFNGVNWADSRDNFVDGWIIPSGIDHRRPIPEVAEQARTILTQLKQSLHINTVRLGINPSTVLDERWWPKYGRIVREATALEMNVVLACWESNSSRDGKIDNPQAFDLMWNRVLDDFKDDRRVYFEIFNEPHGYSDAEWRDLAAAWMERQVHKIRNRDRSRVLVSGSGYNEHLAQVARDQRFDGCRLSFHLYSWLGGKHETLSGWKQEIATRIGRPNATRTMVTEWGAPMRNRPQDYYTEAIPDGDRDRAYVLAMSSMIREWGMGSIYWPGLRDGDDFSLTQRKEGTSLLQIMNESGKTQLQRSFEHNKAENDGE